MVPLQIWDTAGQERFQSLSNTFYRGADCCVITFDITNRDSYEGVEQWRNNFLDSVRGADVNCSQNDEYMVPIILVGNKYDIAQKNNRQVDTRQVYADWIDSGEAIEYIETSA
jgi:Ras-related protein Rab-7A|tara:strand:- start:667 stop:1005 length:339 start_codon:yes stop_codon:yes gene_type:complete